MDNPLIALGSVLAVGLLILLNIWIGGWRRARIESDDQARTRFLEDFWHSSLGDVLRDQEGITALIALNNDKDIGLVHAIGDKFLTRKLEPGSLGTIIASNGHKLVIHLRDFSLPKVTLILDPSVDREVWLQRLLALTHPDNSLLRDHKQRSG